MDMFNKMNAFSVKLALPDIIIDNYTDPDYA